jgi:hypothetical protein
MNWVTRRPHSTVPLAAAGELYKTCCCRELAAAYGRLLAAHCGRLPPKNALDVTALPRVIPHLILCAVTPPDRCIYRIVGEDVKGRIGNRVGRNYYDLVPAARRQHSMWAINMLVAVPCAWRVEIEQVYDSGIARLVEATAFPLASAEPGVAGFIVLADCEIGPSEAAAPGEVTLIGTNILRRDLIDIGFGVDEAFADLVPEPEAPVLLPPALDYPRDTTPPDGRPAPTRG